jgi:hypothetical protein
MTDRRSYLAAFAAAVARKHRPRWSWLRLRRVCACGSELPCRKLAALPPLNEGHWSG